jgi:hypothetical protein
MARSKIALAMLILGGWVAWTSAAHAQAPAPSAPTQPAPPTAAQPAPTAPQAADNPIGSVATLQGSATATRNNTATALKVSDAIFKGDMLQTGSNGTLGITFDDETTFTLRPNSRIVVDDFVYQEGGAGNSALFNITRGTVAFVASQVAKTGDMKIGTPTATMGIRGTSGLVEIPAAGTTSATGQVAIKLYPDADGRVGRIEVFGRDGSQLGILSRGATGFAIRPGLAGGAQRFTAVPLQISAQQAARDRAVVRQVVSAQSVGRQLNIQRRNQQQPNLQRPNQRLPNHQRPNLQRPNQQLPNQQRPITPQRQPGQQTTPAAPHPPALPRSPSALPPTGPQRTPALQRRPGPQTPAAVPGLPGLQKKPGAAKPPAKKPPAKKQRNP